MIASTYRNIIGTHLLNTRQVFEDMDLTPMTYLLGRRVNESLNNILPWHKYVYGTVMYQTNEYFGIVVLVLRDFNGSS